MIAWCKSLLRRFGLIFSGFRAGGERDDLDPEIREVFFAELSDLTQSLNRAFAIWRVNPADQAALQTLRRGFHTLKGSGPIVGAHALGDFCGHIEQLTVRLIERHLTATPDLITTIEQAIALLPAFEKAVRHAQPPPAQARAIGSKARRLLGS